MELTKIAGIGTVTATHLFDKGYDVEAIATCRADELKEEMGVTFTVAKGWIMEAQNLVVADMKLMKAKDYASMKKEKQFFFKTGSTNLNDLLGGGVATWAITGATGRLASGKSQIANDIVVDALRIDNYTCPKCYIKLPKNTKCPHCDADAKPIVVVYIETEPDTFHLERLIEIATKRNITCNWDNLYVCPCWSNTNYESTVYSIQTYPESY